MLASRKLTRDDVGCTNKRCAKSAKDRWVIRTKKPWGVENRRLLSTDEVFVGPREKRNVEGFNGYFEEKPGVDRIDAFVRRCNNERETPMRSCKKVDAPTIQAGVEELGVDKLSKLLQNQRAAAREVAVAKRRKDLHVEIAKRNRGKKADIEAVAALSKYVKISADQAAVATAVQSIVKDSMKRIDKDNKRRRVVRAEEKAAKKKTY